MTLESSAFKATLFVLMARTGRLKASAIITTAHNKTRTESKEVIGRGDRCGYIVNDAVAMNAFPG